MEPFLKSCVDRYLSLAGRDAKPLKQVSTPFHEERMARPIGDEKETKGVLAPIAARKVFSFDLGFQNDLGFQRPAAI
jgi:hypothetical protein